MKYKIYVFFIFAKLLHYVDVYIQQKCFSFTMSVTKSDVIQFWY